MAHRRVVAAAGGLIRGNLLGVDTYLALLGLKVFPVAILGGLDSVNGVLVGGLSWARWRTWPPATSTPTSGAGPGTSSRSC